MCTYTYPHGVLLCGIGIDHCEFMHLPVSLDSVRFPLHIDQPPAAPDYRAVVKDILAGGGGLPTTVPCCPVRPLSSPFMLLLSRRKEIPHSISG